MWYCNSLEPGVWDVGQVWMGRMHNLSKSEGEAHKRLRQSCYVLRKTRRGKKNGPSRQK